MAEQAAPLAESTLQHAHTEGEAATTSHPRAHSEAEAARHGIVPSHGISINFPDAGANSNSRPHPVKHMSAPAPAYQSPIRHHKRAPSKSKGVKETLNARSHYGSSDDDGSAVHRINQYIIKQEIGRGSFGAVHLAVDQFGNEYAVKEFSKSRLRKRAQSNLLRKPNQQRRSGHLAAAAGVGFNSPLHRMSSQDKKQAEQDSNNSLELIKEEIAIMKKLNHNNLVSLIEVLDDPQEDSLYMVLEMCKKGVVMKVGIDATVSDPVHDNSNRAEPYEDETCRCWFRDMILGIEYLHAQGIIHRDLKPDNCLITADDVLKIVDFGVSEMFEKESDMATAKSAGSPAFMPPELCVARHGQVSGRAADIWSMGVTLYCLRYGRIPFEKTGMLELYESIRSDEVPLRDEKDEHFADLMRRLLEKDPEKRISMDDLRKHPWVTKDGTDPLLSAEENCSDLVEPPTEAEMEHAITGNMGHLMVVMKAVNRFKLLLHKKRPQSAHGIFGRESRLVAPPTAMAEGGRERAGRSMDSHDRRPMDKILVTSGVHRDVEVDNDLQKLPRQSDQMNVQPATIEVGAQEAEGVRRSATETEAVHKQREEANGHRPHPADPSLHRQHTLTNLTSSPTSTNDPTALARSMTFPQTEDHARGHAHDPLTDTLFLDIGASPTEADEDRPQHPIIVSESPPAVEMNIYEQAYQEEMKRITESKGKAAGMYLNRRVEHRDDLRSHDAIKDSERAPHSLAGKLGGLAGLAKKGGGEGGGGLAALVKQAKEKQEAEGSKESSEENEEPPLQAPRFDGSGDLDAESGAAKGESEPKVPDSLLKAQGVAQAQLDAAKGAMPGMPGGFPVSPGLKGEGSAS